MAIGSNDPQYSMPGAPGSAQSVNSIPHPRPGKGPTRYSMIASRVRSSTRPTTREQSVSTATSPTEGRSFSGVPSRTTGFTAGKTNVRPMSEKSTPPFAGAGSQIGRASSPLSAPQFKGQQNFEAPGTEEGQSALAQGGKSQPRSTAEAGKPVGPIGNRNGTGARSPKGYGTTLSSAMGKATFGGG